MPRIDDLKDISFIGWKKAEKLSRNKERDLLCYVLVKLEIDAKARCVQPLNHKCRADSATVLEITTLKRRKEEMWRNLPVEKGGRKLKEATSHYSPSFKYTVGATIKVSKFRVNEEECEAGIHFFLTKQEAIDYQL